jgi:hypothetical protein
LSKKTFVLKDKDGDLRTISNVTFAFGCNPIIFSTEKSTDTIEKAKSITDTAEATMNSEKTEMKEQQGEGTRPIINRCDTIPDEENVILVPDVLGRQTAH